MCRGQGNDNVLRVNLGQHHARCRDTNSRVGIHDIGSLGGILWVAVCTNGIASLEENGKTRQSIYGSSSYNINFKRFCSLILYLLVGNMTSIKDFLGFSQNLGTSIETSSLLQIRHPAIDNLARPEILL